MKTLSRGGITLFRALIFCVTLALPATAQQFYYFDVDEFAAYEGGTISGTLRRNVTGYSENVCILFYTNVSGIAPVNVTTDVTGLASGLPCGQPPNNTLTTHFDSGSSSANFSFGVVNNGTVQPERGVVLYIGDGWGPPAPNGSYIQQAWAYLGDNDTPVTVSPYSTSQLEGYVNAFTFTRPTNNVHAPITIRFTLSGSATLNTDYQISVDAPLTLVTGATNQLTIPGSSTYPYTYALLYVSVLNDSVSDPNETITARIEPNSAQYTMPSTTTATMTNLDDTPTVYTYLINQTMTEGAGQIGVVVARDFYYPGTSSKTVNLSIGGTATGGTDYTNALSTSVTIPQSQYAVTNWITPLADTTVEGVETVTVTVLPGNYYVVSPTASNATAYIEDDYPVINVQASDDYASESTANSGNFVITRSGNLSKAVTVQLNVTGTATPGVDYVALPTNVTFAAGITTTNLAVTPIANDGAEPAETVVLNLKTNASYFLGIYTNAVVTLTGEGSQLRDGYPRGERYTRGRGTNLNLYSMVIPLDGVSGTRRSDMEAFGYTTAYHYNATNAASQAYATNRIPFNTPIASFGGVWGTPLYFEQSYSFGLYLGLPTTDPVTVYVFRRSDGGLEGTVELAVPDDGNPTDWLNFSTNGFARSASGYGLTTVLRTTPGMSWGTDTESMVLTHTASATATNYIYLIAAAGLFNGSYAALNVNNLPAYGYLYELTFAPRPAWHSVFIDQPHFQTSPLPPDLLNKTPNELLNFGTAVTNSVALSPSGCTNLDQSPELRRHPVLDQFVADLNNDPLALVNYVQNEIDLTDPIAYRDDGQVQTESVNQGGVNRGALGVYLEGQGSPTEQCALLIYLLRQAGYPATYVFPPEDGLKMLDTRLSSLLRMRINDAQDPSGRHYTTNQLIAVNYPWVATYISNQWIHVFPWIKDTSVEEGLNIYDYLPASYKQMQLWVRDYVMGKTNIMAFATGTDDTPRTVFPRWLDNYLKQNAPGISVDDIGMRFRNRRHLYAQWTDLPRPTWVTNTSTAVESLSASGITNVSPAMSALFDTLQVELYSVANPQKKIQTAPLRTADIHNRKFFITHTNLGGGQVQAMLVLGPFRPDASGLGNFAVADTALTNRQVLTLTLDGTDDELKLRLRHRRQRGLDWQVALDPDRGFFDSVVWREAVNERPLRKGDVAAVCFDAGRVTQPMLRVHAEELWNMEQMLSTNSVATNQVSADVYQGSLTYLAGMSYFERLARFDTELRRLFKVQDFSHIAMGLSKLSPRRNPEGSLYDGPLDPIWPNLDMYWQEIVGVGNGMVRLDSGWDRKMQRQNYFNLFLANGSAEEHATLNKFYGQSNAVSTTKLLQLAQNKVTSGGSNVVELTLNNFNAAGNVVYNGTALKNHDPAIWNQIIDEFLAAPTEFVVAWVPPGTQATTSGSFSGMAALILGTQRYAAIIGNNQYGGYADALPYGSVSAANSQWIEIRADGGGNYYSSFSQPSANQNLPGGETTTLFDLLSEYVAYQNHAYAANPNQNLQGTLNGLMLNGTSGTYGDTLPLVTDSGLPGTKTDFRPGNGFIAQVEDPVNALTGEFYIDDVDLSLPGPMPLQVRRNYGSQNLAPNQLGYGWKLNYMPYLSLAVSNIIYMAEADGSVLAFDSIGENLWAPTLALNPTLNNNSANGVGSIANRLNARLTKSSTNYFLTGGDGSLRVFQEMNFPLTNSASWDRSRPYLTHWYDNRSNFYRFEYGTDISKADYGQVRRVVSSSGNVLRFEYDVYGRIVDAYSLDGRRVRYDYDQHGDLVTVIRPDASELNYEYQKQTWSTNGVTNVYSSHLLVKELKPDGRVLQNEYDGQRRVTNQWSTVGPDLRLVRNATFRYTNDFNLTNLTATLSGATTILDYTNNATTYYYTNGLIRRISYPLGAELVQTWYEASETNAPAYPRSLKTITDKRGLETTFLYDERGNMTNATTRGDLTGDGNPNTTSSMQAFYNANNLPVRTVGNQGTTNLYFYTNTWLLSRLEVWPSGATSAQAITNLYEYGNVTNTTDGTASFGLRVREIRAAFSTDATTNEWIYSSRGFPTAQRRYTGTGDPTVVLTNLFNTRGELVRQSDVTGRSTAYGFDPNGNLESREVYEAGQTVPVAWDYFYYNENGELTWSDGPRFDPEDYVWRDYDGAGRSTQEIRWRSRAKSDGTGVEAVPEAGLYATVSQEFDPLGNLTKATDPRGNYSFKRYDASSRLIREEFYGADGTLLATNGFTYNPAGDVTNAFNPLGGSIQRLYTGTGQPKFQYNADGSTNGWLYYADGRLRREIQNNGAYWETTYNDAARKTTRVFYSSTGTPLATNTVELDRRGNAIRFVDAGGFVFTNYFDGLDRPKFSAGPPVVTVKDDCPFLPGCGTYVTNVLQHSITTFYDAAGRARTNVNALGERDIAFFDALGRPTRSEIRAANGALIQTITAGYAQNHHGLTISNGLGSEAIVTASFTDNGGRPVLNVAYPSATVREFTRRDYDLAGNQLFAGRYAASNSTPTFFSGSLSDYDGLNRLSTHLDRDDAETTFTYNAAGNMVNRTMPGGLQWNAIYNNAGQMLQEWNTGAGGAGARTNVYAYYDSSTPFAGLLRTRTDNVGVASTYSYDDYFRTAICSNASPVHAVYNIVSYFFYDARGLLTEIGETIPFYDAVYIDRTYDAYGQLVSEILGNSYNQWEATQTWDAAGRRSGLVISSWLTSQSYNFGWRADGTLASAAMGGNVATYSYNSAGILTNRTVGSRSTAISALDGTGRPLSITTKASLSTKLTETLAWTGDGLLSAHTLAREDFTDVRNYEYAAMSRRLTTEGLNLDGARRWTNSFNFDGGAAGGPGVLTKVGPVSGSAQWGGGMDAFSRINAATNTFSTRFATGRANGLSTISASLDGQSIPVSVENDYYGAWPLNWRASLALSPGAHQLSVAAAHPSGQFVTNATSWFTNNLAHETVADTYDAAGRVTQRIWKNPNGTTNRTESLTWDVKGRLLEVEGVDAQGNSYVWFAVHDPFGRRIFTWIDDDLIPSYFDPEAEFLELGFDGINGGFDVWKLYGPDLNGVYAGLNGVGGLEGMVTGIAPFQSTISDARGNVLGAVTNGITVAWNPARPTGYGAVPGYRPASVTTAANAAEMFAWRGKSPEPMGYVNLGARYYDLEAGRFLTSDPVWNGRDPNYYTFCGGDPINYFDPDGRLTRSPDAAGTLYAELYSAWRKEWEINYIAGVAASGGPDGTDVFSIANALSGRDLEHFDDFLVNLLKGGATTAAGFIPWVADGMDVYTVGAPGSSTLDRTLSGVSLGANAVSLGGLPNYGPIRAGLSRIAHSFDYLPSASRLPNPPSVPHTPHTPHGGGIPTPPPTRKIPGTPGTVTGGSSTALGKNMMESMGLPRNTPWGGYQAQHIIPSEVANNPILQKVGMNLDDASNGMFLRVPDEMTSAMSRHRGYHSVYNQVVERALNRMDVNLPVNQLDDQVQRLQQNLRYLQQQGTPLYPSQGGSVEMWERLLNGL